MEWTKEIPKKTGWYWLHLNFDMTTIEYIYEDEYEPYSMIVGIDDITCPLQDYLKYDPIFYGPINPPEFNK